MALSFAPIPATSLVRALWDNTKPVGCGVLVDAARGGSPPTSEDIAELLQYPDRNRLVHIDYLLGRPLKIAVDVDRQELHGARLYDRDATGGAGSAERIVAQLRAAYDGGASHTESTGVRCVKGK
jgi:hypothetical protein